MEPEEDSIEDERWLDHRDEDEHDPDYNSRGPNFDVLDLRDGISE